jgi:large subunit ribosomal protein L9
MKVILKEDVENLGLIGDVVEVAAGYARNFLIPRKLGLEFSTKNVARLEHEKRAIAKKREKAIFEAKTLAEKIEAIALETMVAVGEKGKLFGSVTAIDVIDLALKAGITLDRKQIKLERPIKTLGEFKVSVRLSAGVVATLKVVVKPDASYVPEPEPAKVEAPAEASEEKAKTKGKDRGKSRAKTEAKEAKAEASAEGEEKEAKAEKPKKEKSAKAGKGKKEKPAEGGDAEAKE